MEYCLLALLAIVLAIWTGRGLTSMYGAPYVPLEEEVVKRVIRMAKIKKGEIFFDLGSGDGRLVIEAAKKGAKAFGVEISWWRVIESRLKIKRLGLEKRAKIIHQNLFEADLSKADVVTAYLLQRTNDLLEPKLSRELKKGARVIGIAFNFKDWKAKKINLKGPRFGPLYLYKKS
jgi:predicted RNA methylase